MAAHVLRLRLALLTAALRGEAAHVTRTVAGLAVVAGAVALACWALLTLDDAPDRVVQTITVLGGSAVTLAFVVAPLVTGIEDPLDPRRFAVLGVAPAPLAGMVSVAGFLSLPVLALVPLGACLVVVWTSHGVPWPLAVLSVVLAVATCVLLARVGFAVAALVLNERRSRELAGIFLLAVLVVVVPVGVFLASLEWRGRVPAQLADVADILALTPLGAALGTAGVAAVDPGAVWGPLVVAVLTLLVLAGLWVLLVHHMLTTTPRPVAVRERGGLGWFTVTRGTPAGAIAARSLVYWMRDRRYLVNIAVIPVAAALTILPLMVVGVPASVIALVPVPLMALFLGWLPHNDLAYDSTAIWMHIAGAVDGVADRVGRLVPVLLFGVPLLAVTVPLAIWVHGDWNTLPALIGVCTALFLSGLGLSSIASALSPYPVTRPGDSPFQQPQRTGGAAAQALVLIGALVAAVPALWWGWLALTSDPGDTWISLWAGVVAGVAVLLAGVFVGGRVFERASGRLMEFAEAT
ncbi:hypothetical protein NQ156_08400 [Microbacterium sp. zg.Y625]|uniref:hypothetical protein n=1 Tax=Microbacterium jiangjiandongii TaxID=3049071 RepID=UPI00214C65C6|nr:MULTISPECIES: hypothetical protein [unclassified Microbacterium]MCR2793074.1 hypothetical protein [Microbacterium sp. zg.Y625]WIM24185.1 hypothetical protein QNO14_08425 [Microbacterium sp. zg-Y625]